MSIQLTYQNTILKQNSYLTRVSLFFELCHVLWHGHILNTTWSVPTVHYCLLADYVMHDKKGKGSLFSKQK